MYMKNKKELPWLKPGFLYLSLLLCLNKSMHVLKKSIIY